ncbi:c-type cytochrome [Shivajiella indica]|uniref:C-type cytochrome n=1 Tax=Shivajiella indica TaxID=872115 RepID=A0ABW5B8M2_9BACT
MKSFLAFVSFFFCFSGTSCQKPEKTENSTEKISKDYIRALPGENDSLDMDLVKKGEVLIAYADCYDCHSTENKSKGPAFQDIAKRYPVQQVYIDHLARKIIQGSTGAWGYPVMDPHPNISMEDAKIMANFILSLKERN